MSLRHALQAWGQLLRRYASVFAHHWAQRRDLETGFFNAQEAEFLPARLSIQETPASASLRWTACILMALVLCALAWSILGEIDIIVNATGKVIPSGYTKTIGSVDVASVKALYVTEGQTVRAGDLLIELDSSASDAERDKAADAVAQARLQAARAQAMIEALVRMSPPRLDTVAHVTAMQWQTAQQQLAGQYQDFQARLTRLDAEISRYSEALPLAAQKAEDYKTLMADHTVSHHAWLEKEQARVEAQGQLADARHQRATLLAQTRKEAHDSLGEAQKTIEAGQQDLRRAGAHSQLLKLTAPVDGTVQQLTVHTVGGVVPAAQALMQIVPKESGVEVEAFLDNKDVGFVQEGQQAAVKIDAFDYTKYGTLAASVKQVSRDAIRDEKKGLIYSTRIVLARHDLVVDGRSMPLSAGMSVTVDIKTGTRRVIDYLLSPLLEHQQEALHER